MRASPPPSPGSVSKNTASLGTGVFDLVIDVEQLEANFITFNALYTWLQDREAKPPERDAETTPSEKARTRLRRLEKRGAVVAEDALDSLRDADAVDGPAASPLVSFRVECEGCGHRMAMSKFVDLGGCENCTVDARSNR